MLLKTKFFFKKHLNWHSLCIINNKDLFEDPFYILANILFEPLEKMLPWFYKLKNKHQYVIVSGILEEQVDELVKTAQNLGYELKNKFNKNGWSALMFFC